MKTMCTGDFAFLMNISLHGWKEAVRLTLYIHHACKYCTSTPWTATFSERLTADHIWR